MLGVLAAKAVEPRSSLVVLGYPLPGKAAVLDRRKDLLHVLLHVLVHYDRAARVVAVLGGIADRVAHVLHAALVEQVDYQLELVHALEIGRLRLVPGLHQRLEGRLDQRRHASAQHGLLAEQVGLGLLLEGRVQHARAGASYPPGVGQPDVSGVPRDVLLDGQQSGHAGAAREDLAHPVPRRLRRHHGHIDAVRRLYRLVVDVESVGEHQSLAREQVGEDGLPVDLGLGVVGDQHHDDVGVAGDIGNQSHLEAFVFGLGPAPAPLVQADADIEPAVPQVQGVSMALASVADNSYRLVLEDREVRVVVVVHFSHLCCSLVRYCGVWLMSLPGWVAAPVDNLGRRP